jgi:hypothetical protein
LKISAAVSRPSEIEVAPSADISSIPALIVAASYDHGTRVVASVAKDTTEKRVASAPREYWPTSLRAKAFSPGMPDAIELLSSSTRAKSISLAQGGLGDGGGGDGGGGDGGGGEGDGGGGEGDGGGGEGDGGGGLGDGGGGDGDGGGGEGGGGDGGGGEGDGGEGGGGEGDGGEGGGGEGGGGEGGGGDGGGGLGGGGDGGGGDVGGDSLQTAPSSPARYSLSAATSVSRIAVKGFALVGSLAICSSVVLLASGPNPHANTVALSALTLFAASTAV